MSDASTARGVLQGLLPGHPQFGGSWHGPAVHTLLQGITAGQAAARPIPNAKTIWELLLHMTVWQREVLRVIHERTYTPPENIDSWPTPAAHEDAAWQCDLQTYLDSSAALLDAVKALTDDDLNAPVQGAPFPLKVAIHGVAHHSLYHAGQIALLRKALA